MVEKIVEKLDNINWTLEKMLGVMQKPKNKFIQALEIVGLFTGALGIFFVVDLFKRWILGG